MSRAFSDFLRTLQQDWKNLWISLDPHTPWHTQHHQTPTHESLVVSVQDGEIFEKAAINFSHIRGDALPEAALPPGQKSLAQSPFEAIGISTILHPRNPFVPVAHCNVRTFVTQSDPSVWWYAAVMDLNPVYGFAHDCISWHRTCKEACIQAGYAKDYPFFKEACDAYYALPHRNEHRGIGGLWIERLQAPNRAAADNLVRTVGTFFSKGYHPIVTKRTSLPFQDHHKAFQYHRRGRYAEFNLLYDRGTKFGLQFGGNTHNIFVSMPPRVDWAHTLTQKQAEDERKLITQFLTPKDWASMPLP